MIGTNNDILQLEIWTDFFPYFSKMFSTSTFF